MTGIAWNAEGCTFMCDEIRCIDDVCGLKFPSGNQTCDTQCNIKVNLIYLFIFENIGQGITLGLCCLEWK